MDLIHANNDEALEDNEIINDDDEEMKGSEEEDGEDLMENME